VRAKLVKHAWDYKWSSTAYHAGASKKDPLITDSDLFADIDNWRLFLLKKEEDFDTVRKKTRTGRPCGDESFLAKTEKITKRLLLPKKAGRPKKEN
jgi:putative transposase